MRTNMWLRMMGCSLLGLALAVPAGAETVYRWTAADGSLAFTDDAKRVPAQYRSQAKRSQTGDLADYDRYTPAQGSAESYEAKLAARIQRLREINEGDLAGALAHRDRLNRIYADGLPASRQLPAGYQGWRFNLRVDDAPRRLKAIFDAGLFASSHYASMAGILAPGKAPRAERLAACVLNLFNDSHFTEEQARRACEILSA